MWTGRKAVNKYSLNHFVTIVHSVNFYSFLKLQFGVWDPFWIPNSNVHQRSIVIHFWLEIWKIWFLNTNKMQFFQNILIQSPPHRTFCSLLMCFIDGTFLYFPQLITSCKLPYLLQNKIFWLKKSISKDIQFDIIFSYSRIQNMMSRLHLQASL